MDAYQAAKEEIKSTADIVELVGQYVQLKKAGQNHVGLCPFHGEKDPSFTVSQAKQMFHCFGCKKGGDIFAFWMEYHKVSFSQAVKDLAERYRVTLPEKRLTRSQRRKLELREELLIINETAAKYYHHVLSETDKGGPAREYLERRGLNKDIIKSYMLGYAPVSWDSLTRLFQGRRIDMGKAVDAGLIISKKNGGYYDRFRGRVLFPIYNIKKQVVGFGGRVLDESLPKYLNTPETLVFHKGELLYGLHAAYQSIREKGRAVIVEGYTDVLALSAHGFNEAVATLGTALTKDHIRKLKGYAGEAVVVFDSDTAGKGAAIKSLPLFLNEGLSSKVIVLPKGDDPDSFINKRGLENFQKQLNEAIPMFEFYLDQKIYQGKKGIEGQVDMLKEVLPALLELNSDSQRSIFIQRFSEKSGIPESIVLSELKNMRASYSIEKNGRGLRKRLSETQRKLSPERDLLNLIAHYPQAMGRFVESDYQILLSDPNIIEIFRCMDDIYTNEGNIESNMIFERLENESAREKFREVMLLPPICPEDALEQAVDEFKNKISKIKITKSLRESIGNIEKSTQILNMVKDGQN